MNVDSKPILVLSTFGVAVVSVLVGLFLPPSVGAILAVLFAVCALVFRNITIHGELKADFNGKLELLRANLTERLDLLNAELNTLQNEIATKAGLPFVAKYLQLQDGSCPLFKYAAAHVYKKAVQDLDTLADYQIHISSQAEVHHWLEFLFNLPIIKSIKATSCGEFKEWAALETWWMQQYLHLHRVAHERGAQIERIFIVRNDHHAKTVEHVFKSNRKYQVLVKVAIEGRIQHRDMKVNNCLVFFNEQQEPIYALVARHNRKEEFESAIIYGAPTDVAEIATMYSRIENISEIYAGEEFGLQPLKTA